MAVYICSFVRLSCSALFSFNFCYRLLSCCALGNSFPYLGRLFLSPRLLLLRQPFRPPLIPLVSRACSASDAPSALILATVASICGRAAISSCALIASTSMPLANNLARSSASSTPCRPSSWRAIASCCDRGTLPSLGYHLRGVRQKQQATGVSECSVVQIHEF